MSSSREAILFEDYILYSLARKHRPRWSYWRASFPDGLDTYISHGPSTMITYEVTSAPQLARRLVLEKCRDSLWRGRSRSCALCVRAAERRIVGVWWVGCFARPDRRSRYDMWHTVYDTFIMSVYSRMWWGPSSWQIYSCAFESHEGTRQKYSRGTGLETFCDTLVSSYWNQSATLETRTHKETMKYIIYGCGILNLGHFCVYHGDRLDGSTRLYPRPL